MRALDGERTLLEAEYKALVITTHRVRQTTFARGAAQVTSLMVDDVSGCEITHSEKPVLLLLAGVSFLAGLVMRSREPDNGMSTTLATGLVLACILVAGYFMTRRQVVRIASSSTQIRVALVGMNLGESRRDHRYGRASEERALSNAKWRDGCAVVAT
jgi:hypothetical protein